MPSYEDPPPSYEASTSNNSQPQSAQTTGVPPQDTNHLTVPLRSRNGIPPEERRSMEDSARALPEGWVRQYDRETHHQFFVDTRANPPRSIWHHPHDDEQYLASLPEHEREHIKGLQRVHSLGDIEAESSDDDTGRDSHGPQASATHQQQQQQPGLLDTGPEKLSKSEKFGRKLKDKLTSSTHQERAAKRQQRAEAERQAYYQHQHIRRQIQRAVETGEPQLLGKDGEGREVWIEPPQGAPGLHGRGNAHVVNPWNRGGYFGGPPGMMAGPYARPVGPYSRPYGRGGYGYGYGGGMGMAPLLGLGVGMGLGGLMF